MTNEELYKNHPHIISGSIENVQKGKQIVIGKRQKITSHGKIAIIKCEDADSGVRDCLKTRVVNIQDVEQTKYCISCTRRRRNERRRIRRRSQKN